MASHKKRTPSECRLECQALLRVKFLALPEPSHFAGLWSDPQRPFGVATTETCNSCDLMAITEAGPSRSYREPGSDSGFHGKTVRSDHFLQLCLAQIDFWSWVKMVKPHARGSPKIHVSRANLSMAHIYVPSTHPTTGMVLYPDPTDPTAGCLNTH